MKDPLKIMLFFGVGFTVVGIFLLIALVILVMTIEDPIVNMVNNNGHLPVL